MWSGFKVHSRTEQLYYWDTLALLPLLYVPRAVYVFTFVKGHRKKKKQKQEYVTNTKCILQGLKYLLSNFLQKDCQPWTKTKFRIGPGMLISSALDTIHVYPR